MFIGLPATLFLRGRFAQMWPKCDVPAVISEADRLGIDAFPELVEYVLDEMRVPKGFRPRDWQHVPSMSYIELNGLGPMIRRAHAFEVAERLLKCPRPRELIDCALLVHTRVEAISIIVREDYGLRVSPSELRTYAEYFWDARRLTPHQWMTLFELRLERWSNGTPFQKAWVTAAKRVRRMDPRRLMMGMPGDAVSGQLAQVACGIRPRGFDLGATLNEITTMGVLNLAQETRLNSSVMGGPNFASYSTGIKMSLEMAAGLAAPTANLQQHLISMRTDQKRSPSISEITGGNHTLDITKSRPALTAGEKETRP